MASIGGVALKAKLEELLETLLCAKNECLCLGRSVEKINTQMQVAYNWWVVTDTCVLTDVQITCIVSELKQTCDFDIPRQNYFPIPEPIVAIPDRPYQAAPIIYSKVVAYNLADPLSFVSQVSTIFTETFTIWSIKVNGFEYITPGQEPSYTLDYIGGVDGDGLPLGINWVTASNIAYGKTYTEQVDGMNKAFDDLGITDIRAQAMKADAGLMERVYVYPPSHPSSKITPGISVVLSEPHNAHQHQLL